MTPSSGVPPAVLITGTSTGIGAACALDLAQRGFRVFAGVRQETDGAKLQRQAGGNLVPLLLDVTQASAIRAAAAQVEAAVGPAGLVGLVNNAGIAVPGPLELLSSDDLRRQFEVNVIGTHAVTQALLPLLRRARGRIVLVGSISGRVTPPYLGAYAASKHALEALADALRMELQDWGIAVSIIEPDSVATPIWDKIDGAVPRGGGDGDAEVAALYEAHLRQMRVASAGLGRTAIPTSRVVRAVRHALCARWPRARYPVGFRTRLAHWAAYSVPAWVLDWFLSRSMGLRPR